MVSVEMGVIKEKSNSSAEKSPLTSEAYYLLSLFSISLLLRLIFFSGFILCDDAEELPLIRGLVENGPTFAGHLEYRLFLWAFNYLPQKIFGTYEWTFFLPSWILSASLSVIGYLILHKSGYSRREALLAGLLVATAPFEIVIGTLRANDLFLEWFLALALLSFYYFKDRRVLQSFCIALALWGAFYAKLWAIYAFVPLGLYYLWEICKNKRFLPVISFCFFSGAIHGLTCLFWKYKICTYTPFFNKLSATYPVPPEALKDLLLTYPKLIFYGSVDFGNTLFGYVPYIVLGLIVLKLVPKKLRLFPQFKFDALDIALLLSYGSFFLLLNFFPNNFKFDQYYSAPRIFRYLAPISFPLCLHLGKLVIDLLRSASIKRSKKITGSLVKSPLAYPSSTLAVVFTLFCLFSNIQQSLLATRPGREYRKNLLSIVNEAKRDCPPKIIVESWTNAFLPLYLQDHCPGTEISTVFELIDHENKENSHYISSPADSMEWVDTKQDSWPVGTWLVSGLSSCVHYGCHSHCGFQVDKFPGVLRESGWELKLEMPNSQYPISIPERTRVWELRDKENFGLKRVSSTIATQSNITYGEGNIVLTTSEKKSAINEFSLTIEHYLQKFSSSAINLVF